MPSVVLQILVIECEPPLAILNVFTAAPYYVGVFVLHAGSGSDIQCYRTRSTYPSKYVGVRLPKLVLVRLRFFACFRMRLDLSRAPTSDRAG